MSSPSQSDPRLLLPEWLRDGDAPLPAAAAPSSPAATTAIVEEVAVIAALPVQPAAPLPSTPFSERLSLDSRLDPASLVSAADLPSWLGGIERAKPITTSTVSSSSAASRIARSEAAFEEPVPYEGVDAPDSGVIDIQVNGWYAIAAGIVLVVLLAAALRLFLL
jgi:hypothetical protein